MGPAGSLMAPEKHPFVTKLVESGLLQQRCNYWWCRWGNRPKLVDLMSSWWLSQISSLPGQRALCPVELYQAIFFPFPRDSSNIRFCK